MDSVEKIIRYMETGDRPVKIEDGEPTELYDMIDKLKSNPKYYIDAWQGITEFRRAKLMRSNHIPDSVGDEDTKRIEIIHADKNDQRIPKNT